MNQWFECNRRAPLQRLPATVQPTQLRHCWHIPSTFSSTFFEFLRVLRRHLALYRVPGKQYSVSIIPATYDLPYD